MWGSLSLTVSKKPTHKQTTNNATYYSLQPSFDPDQKGSAKNDLMSEVEKNVEADEHAEARITGMGPKGPRKKMSNDTELSFTFSASSTETAEKAKRKEKAQQYGNSAQRTAKADDGLHKLGVKIIQAFKDDIKCEKVRMTRRCPYYRYFDLTRSFSPRLRCRPRLYFSITTNRRCSSTLARLGTGEKG